MQRVRAEVALDDEPGIRARIETGQPQFEHAVQLVLPDPDRRIRPDRHEGDVFGNILRPAGVDIVEAEGARVPAHEIECTLIHVDRPYGRVGRLERGAEGDRPPAAAQIQQVATRRRRRNVSEENLRPDIDALRTENAARGRQLVVGTGEGDVDGTKLECTRRC